MKLMAIGLSILALSLLLPLSVVFGQEGMAAPSDALLRSAYCVPIEEWLADILTKQVQFSTQHVAENPNNTDLQKELAEQRAESDEVQLRLKRLKAYIATHILQVDPTPLAYARQRGTDDLKALGPLTEKCVASCKAESSEKRMACIDSCGGERLARIQSCRNPTWLPF